MGSRGTPSVVLPAIEGATAPDIPSARCSSGATARPASLARLPRHLVTGDVSEHRFDLQSDGWERPASRMIGNWRSVLSSYLAKRGAAAVVCRHAFLRSPPAVRGSRRPCGRPPRSRPCRDWRRCCSTTPGCLQRLPLTPRLANLYLPSVFSLSAHAVSGTTRDPYPRLRLSARRLKDPLAVRTPDPPPQAAAHLGRRGLTRDNQ